MKKIILLQILLVLSSLNILQAKEINPINLSCTDGQEDFGLNISASHLDSGSANIYVLKENLLLPTVLVGNWQKVKGKYYVNVKGLPQKALENESHRFISLEVKPVTGLGFGKMYIYDGFLKIKEGPIDIACEPSGSL